MDLKIEIKRMADGMVAEYEWLDWGDASMFLWEEGNFACDCNRELFFRRARGEPEDVDLQCSDDRYSVRIRNATTGEVLYTEWI